MNKFLDNIATWLPVNRLSLNISKMVYMAFGIYEDSVPSILEIKINNESITRVESYKYLGIYFDHNLKWDKHIQWIMNKTKYLVFIFYKMAKVRQSKTLKSIYYAFSIE